MFPISDELKWILDNRYLFRPVLDCYRKDVVLMRTNHVIGIVFMVCYVW